MCTRIYIYIIQLLNIITKRRKNTSGSNEKRSEEKGENLVNTSFSTDVFLMSK